MPHFTEKVSKGKKINLIESRNVISTDEEICSTFNDLYVSNLNIPANEHFHSNLQDADHILATVNLYDKHPSTDRMKK